MSQEPEFKVGDFREFLNEPIRQTVCSDPLTGKQHFTHLLDPFDEPYTEEATDGLSVDEIKKRWPRRSCHRCHAICYESFQHYIKGDW